MTPENEIRALLDTYEKALGTSDAELAVACYGSAGMFFPTTLPTATGPELRAAYEQIFATIRLDVAFTVDELVVTGADSAHALTRSNGTQTVLADGARSTEANREVFLFGREDGRWVITRYMFNKAA